MPSVCQNLCTHTTTWHSPHDHDDGDADDDDDGESNGDDDGDEGLLGQVVFIKRNPLSSLASLTYPPSHCNICSPVTVHTDGGGDGNVHDDQTFGMWGQS